jgi:putative membrane protein
MMLRGLALALLMILTACGGDGDDNDEADAAALALRESAEQLQEMLAPVRSFGLVAVEFGQLGQQRAGRADVRQFGQTVATDHRALIAVLDSVATAHGTTLQESASSRDLANTVRMAHSGLEARGPEEFDLAFIRAEVESHRQLLDRLDQEILPAARSPGMETMLADTRAMVYAHLMRARQLLGDLLGQPVEPPPAGTSPATVRPPAPQPVPPVEQPPVRDTVPDTTGG